MSRDRQHPVDHAGGDRRRAACRRARPRRDPARSVSPPRSLMRLMPIAPSPSAPESTTAAACGAVRVGQRAEEQVDRHALAAVGVRSLDRRRWPSAASSALPGGMTYTWFGLDLRRVLRPGPPASRVERCRIGGQRALVVRARGAAPRRRPCPLSAGMALKNACSAAMPPAEPPRPTIGSHLVAARRNDVVDEVRERLLGMVGLRPDGRGRIEPRLRVGDAVQGGGGIHRSAIGARRARPATYKSQQGRCLHSALRPDASCEGEVRMDESSVMPLQGALRWVPPAPPDDDTVPLIEKIFAAAMVVVCVLLLLRMLLGPRLDARASMPRCAGTARRGSGASAASSPGPRPSCARAARRRKRFAAHAARRSSATATSSRRRRSRADVSTRTDGGVRGGHPVPRRSRSRSGSRSGFRFRAHAARVRATR